MIKAVIDCYLLANGYIKKSLFVTLNDYGVRVKNQ